MTADETMGFAAFRAAVFDDFHLLMRLRSALPREAYVAHVVATGAGCGFVFDASNVRAAMRDGEQAWLTQGVEIVD